MDRQDVNIRGNWVKLYMELCSILQLPYESKIIPKIHSLGEKNTLFSLIDILSSNIPLYC